MPFDPDDGFRVRLVGYGGRSWLELSLYDQGVPVPGFTGAMAVELAGRDNPDSRARGELIRLRGVLTALARYFNLGGDWKQLDAVLVQLRGEVPGGRTLDGLYFRYTLEPVEDAWFRHLFLREDGTGVEWRENDSVEELDRAAVQELKDEVYAFTPDDLEDDDEENNDDEGGTAVSPPALPA